MNIVRIVQRYWLFIAIVIIIVAALITYGVHMHIRYETQPITIILSPHYDDAVLSLGGLMSQRGDSVVVATFFTGRSEMATSTEWDAESGFSNSAEAYKARVKENQEALLTTEAKGINYEYEDNQYRAEGNLDQLKFEISQDIQALIASYSGRTIEVYGPSTFGSAVTHPDHELLHEAFLDVADSYPAGTISFFLYEDYPYVEEFNKIPAISLQKNLETDSGHVLLKKEILLSSKDVAEKIITLKKYGSQVQAFSTRNIDIISATAAFTESRCGEHKACEVVYEIPQY